MQLGVHYIDFLPGRPRISVPRWPRPPAPPRRAVRRCSPKPIISFRWRPSGVRRSVLEGYTSLGFLAGQTQRIALAAAVTGVTYRYPGVLAKIVTTLDVLSGGRSVLGIGAAWYEREHVALGVPYLSVATRFEMLEETLQICRQMWSDDNGPYRASTTNLPRRCACPRPFSGRGRRS